MDEIPESLLRALGYPQNYVEAWSVEGPRVALVYARDASPWPWAALPTWHPVVVDKLQFFSAITAGWAMQASEGSMRSALTGLEWASETPSVERAARGLYEACEPERGIGYRLDLFDGRGNELLRTSGEGVVFDPGEFSERRRAAKQQVAAASLPPPEVLVDPVAAGLGAAGRALVSPLRTEGSETLATGWVTAENGLPPHHPFHTGSGDHVNAGHLLDCAMQCAHLALGTEGPLYCRGGRAEFRRFVELGVPFEIAVWSDAASPGAAEVRANFRQRERECCAVRLELDTST